MASVYEIVTDTVVRQIEQAIKENKKLTWAPSYAGSCGVAPLSTSTGKRYGLLNELMLRFTAQGEGFSSRWWTTLKKANELGGKIKPGSKSTIVTFWGKTASKPDPNKRPGEISSSDLAEHWFLRYYRVFNFDQVEWIGEAADKVKERFPEKGIVEPMGEFTPVEAVELFLAGLPEQPKRMVGPPAYSPKIDTISMPEAAAFISPEAYYQTLMHELTHWTGHSNRMNRKGVTDPTKFGSSTYAAEELVAELGAAFALADLGMEPKEQTVAYIQSWLSKLKNDVRLIVVAAGQAERAVKWMKGQKAPHEIQAAKQTEIEIEEAA